MSYKDNEKRKVFNIDFDGTLTKDLTYSNDPTPNIIRINKVRKVYYAGHIIIIWTARRWCDAALLVSWLIKYDVPFHGIYMSKGGSDYYIDDKNMAIEDFDKLELN